MNLATILYLGILEMGHADIYIIEEFHKVMFNKYETDFLIIQKAQQLRILTEI